MIRSQQVRDEIPSLTYVLISLLHNLDAPSAEQELQERWRVIHLQHQEKALR